MRNWTYQKTISPAETFAVQYRKKIAGPPVRYEMASASVSFPAVSEVTTTYEPIIYYDKDGKKQIQDVVASTISVTTTCVGAANGARWQSKLEAGSPAFAGTILTRRTESFNKYIITEDGPVEWQVTTFEYEPRIAFAGGLAIENYKNIDLGTGKILLRKTIVEKEENKLVDLSKQTTVVYQAWGATAGGKTVAATIMGALKKSPDSQRISGTYTLVEEMSALVCSGIEKTINIGRGTAPAQPSELDQQNENLRGAQERLDSNGAWDVTGPKGYRSDQLTDLSFGSDGTNSTDKYEMEFAPDSYLRPSTDAGDNGTGLNYVYVSSQAAAYEYGRAIYAILSGMANGKSITTELRNLPSEPMGTLYLEAAGTVGRFRANGTTFAFDSQGLIAGCDAMLDGGAGKLTGASGTDWFPLMVAASNLPTVTTTTNSTPGLANTINAPSGFDPMAPGNIWASFGTAGVEGDVYAVELTRAHVVPAMQENVRRESVSRSLSWVLEAPYSLTTSTESITSVSVSYGTASVVYVLYAGSGSGVIADLSAAIIAEPLYAGSGSGVIADLSAAIITEPLFVGSGSGVIADLSAATGGGSGTALLSFTGSTLQIGRPPFCGFTFTLSESKTIKGVGFYDNGQDGLEAHNYIYLTDVNDIWTPISFDAAGNKEFIAIPNGTAAPLSGPWRRADLSTAGRVLQTGITYALITEMGPDPSDPNASVSSLVDYVVKNATGVSVMSGASYVGNIWDIDGYPDGEVVTNSSAGTAFFGPMIFFE